MFSSEKTLYEGGGPVSGAEHFQTIRDRLAPDPTRLSAALERVTKATSTFNQSLFEKFRQAPRTLRRILTGLMLSSALAGGGVYAAESAHDAGVAFNSIEDITNHIKSLEQAAHAEHLSQKEDFRVLSHSESTFDGHSVTTTDNAEVNLATLQQPLLVAHQVHSLRQFERQSQTGEAHHGDIFRKEMYVYQLDAAHGASLKPLQHVHVSGWGATEAEATANALKEAAANASIAVNVDTGSFGMQHNKNGATSSHELFYDYSTATAEVALTAINAKVNYTEKNGGQFIVTLDADASSL